MWSHFRILVGPKPFLFGGRRPFCTLFVVFGIFVKEMAERGVDTFMNELLQTSEPTKEIAKAIN
jgi:hypothetical protein